MTDAVNGTVPKKCGILALPRFVGLVSMASSRSLRDRRRTRPAGHSWTVRDIEDRRDTDAEHGDFRYRRDQRARSSSRLQPAYAIGEDPESDIPRTMLRHPQISCWN